MIFKIKQYLRDNTGFLLRFDDIAENMDWEKFTQIELVLDKNNIKPVLGIIPLNKDSELLSYPRTKKDFWDRVRKWKAKGWEIAMHGTYHVYDNVCELKQDYLGYGGNTEFAGHTLERQIQKIKIGLKKFRDENINPRCFFAPNHTFDSNTLIALKKLGIFEILDGYGLAPYEKYNMKFIPQLFYKTFSIPFGIQSFQIHVNYFSNSELYSFINFLKNNQKKFLSYKEALSKVNNNFSYKIIRIVIEKLIKIKRAVN
jgi:hypothetical protein